MGEPAEAWVEEGEIAAEAQDESAAPSAAPSADDIRHLRMLEAILFAAAEPLSVAEIALRMPEGIDLLALLAALQADYAARGVNLRRSDDRWAFRTAEDLAFVLKRDVVQEKKLSRAAIETLAVIAYHQPVTRAEIEEVRGVAVSKGTLDVLLEAGWVRLRGRRRTPGRPVTFGTTPEFLDHFGLESIGDLPGLADLRAAGLIETLVSPDEVMPSPNDNADLADDEDPLEPDFDEYGVRPTDSAEEEPEPSDEEIALAFLEASREEDASDDGDT
jgi:segregation and condensation protein B